MRPVRFLTRSLLGGVFVYSGLDVLRNPEPRAKVAAPVLDRLTDVVPGLPQDSVQLVQINAGLQLGAASMLMLGKLPRLSALALAGSLVPTTAAGHRFWEEEEPQRAAQQRVHFLKNVAILGGLLSFALQPSGRRRQRRRSRPQSTP